MGKYKTGILGYFDGKIGPVVGSRWKGVNYMRSMGRTSSKAPTQAQLAVRARFKLVTGFVHKFGKLFMSSFKPTAMMTGINVAFSYTANNAIRGQYPLYELDFGEIKISAGETPLPTLPAAAMAGGGIITFSWQDNSPGNKFARPADKVVMAGYCAATNQVVFNDAGAVRTAGTDTLNVSHFIGKIVQTWLSFVSEDGKEFATSIYTGAFVVA